MAGRALHDSLRRQLIVDEHGTLPYPEGTACADVLMAGERGGSLAAACFLGWGSAALYTLFQNENLFERVARHAGFEPDFGPTAYAQGRSDPRGRDAGVPGGWLHHRDPSGGDHSWRAACFPGWC